MAQVEVDRISGAVRVTRAWAAVDAGMVVNPDGVRNQIEGGLIQSTSWTLKEALKVDRTGVQTRSWGDYPILRFSEVPAVDIELIQRPGDDSLGVGEGAQGPTGAAIANAFAAATGAQVTRHSVRAGAGQGGVELRGGPSIGGGMSHHCNSPRFCKDRRL